jgi:hypothetical protein
MKTCPWLISSFLVVFVSGLFQSQLYAQKITIGVKGGLSIPNLTAGDEKNPLNKGYSSRMGSDAGVFAEYHMSGFFSSTIGVEYCAQGGKKNGMQALEVPEAYSAYVPAGTKYLYADYKSEAKLDYLLFPVMARIRYSVNSLPLSIYASAGPFLGVLVKAEQETRGAGTIYLDEGGTTALSPGAVSFHADTDIRSDLNTYNIGIMGLAGVSADFGVYSVFAEGGGNFGFIPIQKDFEHGKNYIGAAVITIGCSYTFGN